MPNLVAGSKTSDKTLECLKAQLPFFCKAGVNMFDLFFLFFCLDPSVYQEILHKYKKKYLLKGFFLNLHLQSMTGVIDDELPCGVKSR